MRRAQKLQVLDFHISLRTRGIAYRPSVAGGWTLAFSTSDVALPGLRGRNRHAIRITERDIYRDVGADCVPVRTQAAGRARMPALLQRFRYASLAQARLTIAADAQARGRDRHIPVRTQGVLEHRLEHARCDVADRPAQPAVLLHEAHAMLFDRNHAVVLLEPVHYLAQLVAPGAFDLRVSDGYAPNLAF